MDFDQKLYSLAQALNATLILEAVGGEFTQRLVDASPDKSLILLYSNLSGEAVKIKPNSLWQHDRRVEGFFLGTWARNNSLLKLLLIAFRAQKWSNSDLRATLQKRLPLSAVQEGLELYHKNMSSCLQSTSSPRATPRHQFRLYKQDSPGRQHKSGCCKVDVLLVWM